MINTAILILNWNGSDDTISCLKTLLPNLTENDYLFIIDNGSTDKSISNISDYFASINLQVVLSKSDLLEQVFNQKNKKYIICNSKNIGFGSGHNIVLKKLLLLNNNFNFAWLLNNDALVTKDSLLHLKASLSENDQISVVGSIILNHPDTNLIQCTGVKYYKYLGVSKLVNKNKPYHELNKDKKIDFDYLNGASLMFNLNALNKVGYFDENFFLYSEELDLQLRLIKNGYKIHLNIESVVSHKLGVGTRKNKYLFYYYYNTSALLLTRKHYSSIQTIFVIINLIIITIIRTFPSLKNLKWAIKGIIKGLRTK